MRERWYRLPRTNKHGYRETTADPKQYCDEWNVLGRYAKELFGENYVCTGFDPLVHFAEEIPTNNPSVYRPGHSFTLTIDVIKRLNELYEKTLAK